MDSDAMHMAADLSKVIPGRILALQNTIVKAEFPIPVDLDQLLSAALMFREKICRLPGINLLAETSSIPAVSPPMPMAAGGSMGDSSPIPYLGPVPGLHREEKLRVAGVFEEQDMSIGSLDDEILQETIRMLAQGIMLKCEAEGPDLARMLDVKKIRKEAKVALRFGLDFELFGKYIDELEFGLRSIISAFSPQNSDVRSSMIMLAKEPYLVGVANLRWISELISMLRRMDPDLDSQVKSRMLELKSESFLASLREAEDNNGEGVVGEAAFAAYRLCWERHWGDGYNFEDQTLLSPMQFTHCMPSCVPVDVVAGSTLQIYSIKVSIKVSTEVTWPLNVYGVVTARDSVDRQRNPLFIRPRNYCQIVTKDHPFLHLTGPVRAIVAMDTVYIETELKAKGRSSEDIVLASTVINSYPVDKFSTSLAENKHCTIELCFEELKKSVQATIVSVVVTSNPGSVPFPYGGKIICSTLSCSDTRNCQIPPRQAVVFDSKNGELIKDRAGHLDLDRRVLSVELRGELQFHTQRYSQPGSAEVDAQVLRFTPRTWNITKSECSLDDGSLVVINVAWSLISRC